MELSSVMIEEVVKAEELESEITVSHEDMVLDEGNEVEAFPVNQLDQAVDGVNEIEDMLVAEGRGNEEDEVVTNEVLE